MKKTLLTLLAVVVVLLLVAYIGAQFFLGSIVKAGVNSMGPRLTQAKVELAGAKISPLSGAGTLTGLTVGNPPGWSGDKALYVGSIHFDVVPTSLLHETVVINDLSVEQPEFTYETHIVSSNIGDLMKNIESAVGTSDTPQEKSSKPPHKYIVKHFHLANAKVSVGVGPAAVPLTIPAIDLTDLGVKENGLTSGQLAFAVTREILPNIIEATTDAAGKLTGTMGAAASDAVKKAGQSLQKFFGGKK